MVEMAEDLEGKGYLNSFLTFSQDLCGQNHVDFAKL